MNEEPRAAAERRRDAYLYMIGCLEAVAVTVPAGDPNPVRDALLAAVDMAERAGYLSPDEAREDRRRLWRSIVA